MICNDFHQQSQDKLDTSNSGNRRTGRIRRSLGAETTGLQGGRGGAGRDGSPAPSGHQFRGGKSGPFLGIVCQSYAVFFYASRDGEAIRGVCRCRARGLPRGRRAAAGRRRPGGASRGSHDPAAQVVPSGSLGRNQVHDVAKRSALRSEWPEYLEFRLVLSGCVTAFFN